MTERATQRPTNGVARLGDIVLEGVSHVLQHPLRSALTALTSAVAIAVTVNVISLSRGLNDDVRRDISRFGRLTLDVGRLPVLGVKRESLGPADAERVRESLDGLDAVVVPRRQVSARATGTQALDRVQVVSAPPAYALTLGVDLLAGRWLGADDPGGSTCALDAETARQLFPDTQPESVVGRRITVTLADGIRDMRVVGVLEDPLTYRVLFETFDEGRGARSLASSLLSFRNVYVRETVLPTGELTGISIRMPDEASVDEGRMRLLETWDQDAGASLSALTRGIGVLARKDWMDAMNVQAGTGALLSDLIWIIIVGVAVIMISTLNLITVRERYDELAIRRCEGARRRDVALQITVEGVVTSLLGGLAGLPLGYLGAALLRDIVDFPFRFDPVYAAIATVIAGLLGLVASVLPARHAARLEPARVLSRRLT